mmetsp:Transcript_14334/g.26063  ORF Transcript_14334/g.26063 Transcript_14334/m.26063 type:complete len:84 (-) Transcript_14334:210-461(-)
MTIEQRFETSIPLTDAYGDRGWYAGEFDCRMVRVDALLRWKDETMMVQLWADGRGGNGSSGHHLLDSSGNSVCSHNSQNNHYP